MNYIVTSEDLKKFSKVDWIIHAVCDETFKEGMCDAHTHGLDQYLGKELQIVLRVSPDVIQYILNSVGMLIADGYKFQAGDMLYGLFENHDMPITFMDAKDYEGVDILRVWLPDENGTVYPDQANGVYGRQGENPDR